MNTKKLINPDKPDRCSTKPFCQHLKKVRGTYHCTLTNEEVDNGDEEDGSDYIFLRTESCKGKIEEEYDDAFVGEVEIFHFENSREALARQSIRFDEPKVLEMSPVEIKNFLLSNKFDLSIDGAVLVKTFDFMSSWDDYFIEMSDWLGNGQIPNDEPKHPDVVCYQTMYLRAL